MSLEIPIQELPLKGIGLLRKIIIELSIDPQKQPHEYVLVMHTNHIAQLAEEIVFLESNNYRAASPVIARAVYESLFRIGLALKNPELAAVNTLREMEWSMIQGEIRGAQEKELKEIRKRPEYKSVGETVASLTERWKLTNTKIFGDKKLSTFRCAKEAGMENFYHGQYSLLSAFAHGSGDTFIYRAFGTTGYVLLTVTTAVKAALVKIVSKYQGVLSEQSLIDVQNFKLLFESYIKNGQCMNFLTKELMGTKSPPPTSPQKHLERN